MHTRTVPEPRAANASPKSGHFIRACAIALPLALISPVGALADGHGASAPKTTTQSTTQPTTQPTTKAAGAAGSVAAPGKAPETYTVRLETTKGDILIDVTRAWAPKGADRFYELVRTGYYDDVAFFRVIKGFMAQVGMNGDPAVNASWRTKRIEDDPVTQSNSRGMVTFATSGANSRTTQVFINYGNNGRLDGMGFAPFGKVQNMKPVDALNGEYGEGAPRGRGPSQGRVHAEGNAYLKESFPRLDYIERARID